MALSDEQIDRYSRQIIVPGIGGRGQERLLESSVLIAGSDAVARTAALYLAGAGVGRIDVAAHERTWPEALVAEIVDLNPDVRTDVIDGGAPIDAYDIVLAVGEAIEPIVRGAHSKVRRLITAVAAKNSGGVTVSARVDPHVPCPLCAADALEGAAPTSAAPSAGLIGSLAALQVLRLLLGLAEDEHGRWLGYDGETSALEERTDSAESGCEHRRGLA